MRLDLYLTEKGYFESRNKSADAIKKQIVFVDGKCIQKPSFDIGDDSTVEIKGDYCCYVGRGGLKLECVITEFNIDLNNKVCVDIGSSTGGFTDCLLQNGAEKVYAVDSGKDQLHQKLRSDSRVICMESFNARYLKESDIGEKCDIVTMDVSFISQTMLYEAVTNVLKIGGLFISLIKPQFEVGKCNIGKNGIVKNEKIRSEVCKKICENAKLVGLENIEIIDSPILGGDGNKEYLALFRYAGKC